MVTAIVDSKTSPILVRKDVLPTSRLADKQPVLVNVKAVGSTSFRVKSVVRFLVKIGGNTKKAVFEVAPKLAAKMILGTALVHKKITNILTKGRQIILRSGHAVAIVANFEDEVTM